MTEKRTDLSTQTLADAGAEPARLSADKPRKQSAKYELASAELLPADMSSRFREKWDEIQTGFVDEPRRSVEHADQLVADLMQRLASSFSDERGRLENQWDRGDDVSTEVLRVALTRYRSFFERLLSA
jgi:hypothetical protein